MSAMPQTMVARVGWGALIAALLVAPWLFYPLFLVKVLCYALFACAFNLLLGTCGLMSFGHAAFFGSAAYIAGHAAKVWGLPFEASLVCAVAGASLIGVVFGYISIRRQGIYFAMITLALAQLIYFLALQLPFTHAEDGLTAIPRGKVLGLFPLDDNMVMYYTTAVIFLSGFSLIHVVMNSTFGQVVRAVRDNEMRAVSLGFEVNRFKLLAFTLSAAIAGLAGANKAIAFKLATLVDVHWSTSGNVVLMTLLGGLGTLFGPVAGAVIFVALENYLADSGLPVQLVDRRDCHRLHYFVPPRRRRRDRAPVQDADALKPVRPVRPHVHRRARARHHLGDQPAGEGAECQAVVGVAEREPEILMFWRGPDDRHHVRRAGARAHPCLGIETFGEREQIAGDRLGAAELHRRADRIAQRELRAGGQPDAALHRRDHIAALDVEHRMVELRLACRAIVHVIAALHRQRQVVAECAR